MRLVDGSDLASLIKDGPLAPARALGLLAQVAEALDNLHGRGLVHLDVKPANVLVTSRESSGEHVYVADFGLTRRGATGHRTRGGDFLGSPTYAAPEHLRGEPVDGRTDEYSLACVLFACLAGRPPFQGEVPAVIQGHLNRDAPRLTEFVALPPAIDEVVRRGMAKTPTTRYVDCRELIAAARQALLTTPPPRVPAPVSPAANGHAGYGPRTGPPSGPTTVGPQPVARPTPQPAPFSIADPVRLRPPAPIGATAFGAEKRGNRWIAPVIVGLVAIGLIITAILLFSSDDSGGDNDPGNTPPEQSSSVPKVKVGSDSPASSTKKKDDSGGGGGPSSLPVHPPSR
jgi:serine/threonine protein kinase